LSIEFVVGLDNVQDLEVSLGQGATIPILNSTMQEGKGSLAVTVTSPSETLLCILVRGGSLLVVISNQPG
jgi:hypothetical protein